MISLTSMTVAIAMGLYFVFVVGQSLFWRGFVAIVVLGSVSAQVAMMTSNFQGVHPLVPTLVQVGLVIGIIIGGKISDLR